MLKQTDIFTGKEHRLLRFEGEGENGAVEKKTEAAKKADEKKKTANALGSLFQSITKSNSPAAKKLEEDYAKAKKDAMNRFNLSPLEYQQRIVLQQGEKERVNDHFARVHFGPNGGQPRKLILVIQGNNERLTAENDIRRQQPNGEFLSQRGGEYIFDELVRLNDPDTDVIQIKVGEQHVPFLPPPIGRTPEAPVHTPVAWAHLVNLVNDAMDSEGIFTDRQYATMNVFGTSYGAGAAQKVLTDISARRRKEKLFTPRAGTSVYLDGVVHDSVAVSLTSRPPTESHFHIYQQNWTPDSPVQGAPFQQAGMKNLRDSEVLMKNLTNPDPNVRPSPLPDHREMNSSYLNRDLFDGQIIPALRETHSPFPTSHPGPGVTP